MAVSIDWLVSSVVDWGNSGGHRGGNHRGVDSVSSVDTVDGVDTVDWSLDSVDTVNGSMDSVGNNWGWCVSWGWSVSWGWGNDSGLVGGSSLVGRGRLVGGLLGVDSGALVGHISHVAVIAV